MRRSLIACSVAGLMAPHFAAANETTFQLSTSYLGGSFLGQHGLYGFNHGRDNGSLTLTAKGQADRLRYQVNLGFDVNSEDVDLDGSYIEYDFGNWVVGAGAKDQHWGPSNYTSLILSKNARPLTAAYVSKEVSQSNAALLSWLGPWYADLIIGQHGGHMAPADTNFIGMRLGAEPLPGLDIEVTRTVQWGGAGRDNSVERFGRLLLGSDTNTGAPANQMAGYSVSYTLPDHIAPLRFYYQGIGEDEADNLPSCFMHMAGVETKFTAGGVPTVLTLEAVDTTIDRTNNGNCGANTAYRNAQFGSGYTNYGTVMGAPIDTESQSLTLYGSHEFDSLNFNWSVGHYDINKASLATHRLSATNVSGVLATVGATKTWGDTSLTGVIAVQDFDLNAAPSGASVGFNLKHKF